MTAESPELAGHEEEKLDVYFFRPLAHPFALVFAKLGFTPNGVSFLGLLVGVAAGWFFQFADARLAIWGVALFCLRNILDYADGQLARLTGKGTKYGYYFDGVCDYGAYMSVYVFGALGIWSTYGWATVPLVIAAGVSAAIHSPLLDYYKHEYVYFAVGRDSARCRAADELVAERATTTGLDRVLVDTAISYARRQAHWTGFRRSFHALWAPLRSDASFRVRYSKIQRWPLKLWFLVGPNWQAYFFFAAALLGRMDLYFWAQITWMNAIFVLALVVQREADRRVVPASEVGALSGRA